MNDQTFKVRDNLKIIKTGNEAVIYSQDGEKIHVLNRTAYFIWERLSQNKSLTEIERDMIETFMVDDPSRLTLDIQNTISKLRSLDLLL
ncbi:PqqD family protein [bacterium]|nr:PqqD family protein [bacterium]